tara:strand:+ start:43 stop:810 length:768 start_codon:yes stop_codon:yes gene_type:complete
MSSENQGAGFSLSGLNILILGAKLGIGASLASICANQNANIILADKEEPLELADNLRQKSPANVSAYACDISDREAVDALAAKLCKMNCAPHSVAITAGVTFYNDWIDADNNTWERDVEQIFNVNLSGPINIARSFLPIMEKNRWGRMVLVGSIAGRMGGLTSQPHYAASKGGVHSLTRWLASKYAPSGVLVNAVAPGPTKTRMTEGRSIDTSKLPLKRMLDPEDIAWPIAFLLSPAAAGMVGVVLDVNGGATFS